MPTTGSAQYPYPNASDVPDVAGDLLLLGQRLAKMNGVGIGYTANATTRAALVTDGDVFEGFLVFQADTGVIYKYTSSAWRAWESNWISYTPTFTNFTIGTGGAASNTSSYKYVAGDVRMYGSAVLGTSGASVGTTVSFTLPVTAQTPPTNYYYGTAGIMIDSGTTERNIFIRANGTSTTSAQLLNANATTGLPQGVTSTSPWTWAAGDSVNYDFTYRAA